MPSSAPAHALALALPSARRLFNTRPRRNIISYNALVVLVAATEDFPPLGPIRCRTGSDACGDRVLQGQCRLCRWELFDKMPDKSLAPWTAMITGFSRCGKLNEALARFTSSLPWLT
ncbi:hypothetical protein OPV22_001376 [Ensete ventricosum]|uniref:Pentatricopeptide repeat-containing protein n=1 Tax=Ensete ventricosum TaxID=4639 RepID=A0AAV8RQ28_ENSVE|nr:hypothetical protein OPV22_001376 [Ensete ventricosum]